MSINRVDFGVIANTSEISTIKSAEEARPLSDQQSFQAIFKEEVNTRQHSINTKDNADGSKLNSDAREKSGNEYAGDGGKNRKNKDKDNKNTHHLSISEMQKIGNGILSKDGKPKNLEISSGFDFKI